MNSNKIKRINKIAQILKDKDFNTQEDIVNELKKCGIKITQATLSRDIAEAGFIKVHSNNGIRYKIHSEDSNVSKRYGSMVVIEIKSISHNENLVVVKTLPGCAQSVAVVIDSWNHSEILSTVAGDDTVLVVPKRCKETKKIYNFLKNEWKL